MTSIATRARDSVGTDLETGDAREVVGVTGDEWSTLDDCFGRDEQVHRCHLLTGALLGHEERGIRWGEAFVWISDAKTRSEPLDSETLPRRWLSEFGASKELAQHMDTHAQVLVLNRVEECRRSARLLAPALAEEVDQKRRVEMDQRVANCRRRRARSCRSRASSIFSDNRVRATSLRRSRPVIRSTGRAFAGREGSCAVRAMSSRSGRLSASVNCIHSWAAK